MQNSSRNAEIAARLDEALALAAKAGRASRHHAEAVQLLRGLGRHREAAELLALVAELPTGSAEDHEALGFAAFQAGAHELSRNHYARTVDAMPGDALAWYNLASGERNLGRLDVAEAASNKALELAPTMAQAALLRSQLRTQTAADNHVDELRAMLARAPAGKGYEVFLHYALGKEFDDLGDHDAAFDQFAKGAAARRSTLDYDVAQDLFKLARIAESFDAPRLAAAPPLAPPAYGFIVGLPRSGTTMIERILTGNPAAYSNGETDNLFGALGEAAAAAKGPDIFERVALADSAQVRAGYARRAGVPAARELIFEKLPFNYLYAGALRLTLPDARTLLVRRAPADNLFAMFSTLFGSGYPFSYALGDLADYYCAYDKLCAHWRNVVGAQMLQISYEDVVADPKGQGQAIAAHFGLAWDDDMTRIEKNASASATASAAQVRRPIYSSAKGRWLNYARHLWPLTEKLERAGIDPARSF